MSLRDTTWGASQGPGMTGDTEHVSQRHYMGASQGPGMTGDTEHVSQRHYMGASQGPGMTGDTEHVSQRHYMGAVTSQGPGMNTYRTCISETLHGCRHITGSGDDWRYITCLHGCRHITGSGDVDVCESLARCEGNLCGNEVAARR
ncbi:hypothetical protein ACOMHN_009125 [Nucella lapillus]